MRRRFRFNRFINQHGQRQHWLSSALSAEEECYDELAVIADHFASLANGGDQGVAARTGIAPRLAPVSRQRTTGRGRPGPRRWHR